MQERSLTANRGRALLFAPYGAWGIHWATTLEIAERLHAAGRLVDFVRCRSDLPQCDVRKVGGRLACEACSSWQKSGMKRLSRPVRSFRVSGTPESRRFGARAPVFESTEDLISHRVDNFEVGESVASTLMSAWWNNSASLDFSDANVQRDAANLFRSAVLIYFFIRDRLRRESYEDVVVFNGRLAVMRAVVRAAQAEGVSFWTHERGADLNRFCLFKDRLPHDRSGMHEEIRDVWRRGAGSGRRAEAAAFYEERRRGYLRNWRGFTAQQEKGSLPALRDSRRCIAVFTSTESEFVGLGAEWRNDVYRTQLDGLAKIVDDLRSTPHPPDVVIRIHPNTTQEADIVRVAALAGPQVHVARPDSAIDSYALIDRADVVLTFGSTIGIEAAYWGKPVVTVGPSEYSGLGSTYEPKAHDQVMSCLRGPLAALPRLGADMFGFWQVTRGETFRFASEPVLGDAFFKGRRIETGLWGLLSRVKRRAQNG